MLLNLDPLRTLFIFLVQGLLIIAGILPIELLGQLLIFVRSGVGALDFFLETVESWDVINAFIFVKYLVFADVLLLLRLLRQLFGALILLGRQVFMSNYLGGIFCFIIQIFLIFGPLRAYALFVHMIVLLLCLNFLLLLLG